MYHKMLRDICAKYGKKYTKELQARMTGLTDKQICVTLVKEFRLKMTADELEREIDDLSKIRLPQAPLQKGVERLLNHLHDDNIPFALATNSTRRAVRVHEAAKAKLFGMFHHKVCVTDPDVDRGKPHPDIYLVAASKFPENPKPVKCLVFEDSVVGMEAGIAAGMQVVLIPQKRLPPPYEKRATLVLKSLLDFRPEIFGLPPFTDLPKKPRVSSLLY